MAALQQPSIWQAYNGVCDPDYDLQLFGYCSTFRKFIPSSYLIHRLLTPMPVALSNLGCSTLRIRLLSINRIVGLWNRHLRLHVAVSKPC